MLIQPSFFDGLSMNRKAEFVKYVFEAEAKLPSFTWTGNSWCRGTTSRRCPSGRTSGNICRNSFRCTCIARIRKFPENLLLILIPKVSARLELGFLITKAYRWPLEHHNLDLLHLIFNGENLGLFFVAVFFRETDGWFGDSNLDHEDQRSPHWQLCSYCGN